MLHLCSPCWEVLQQDQPWLVVVELIYRQSRQLYCCLRKQLQCCLRKRHPWTTLPLRMFQLVLLHLHLFFAWSCGHSPTAPFFCFACPPVPSSYSACLGHLCWPPLYPDCTVSSPKV